MTVSLFQTFLDACGLLKPLNVDNVPDDFFFFPIALIRGGSGEAAGGEPDRGRVQTRSVRVRHLQTGETTSSGGSGSGRSHASEVTVMER